MIEELHDKAMGLPLLPGVYIMKDRQSKVIYVGKARQLRNRVSSYFHGAHDVKTEAMVSKVADFDYIIADSEFEALILENSLIKHHMPKYNIKLRDDKGYPFIRVDMKSEYPSFDVVSKTASDGALYLGPYGGRSVTHEVISTVSLALKIPTCGKNLSRIIGKERPCLNFHMGTCRAYCQSGALAVQYKEAVETAIEVMQGKTAKLVDKLTEEMEKAAESLSFELAAEKRDSLRAIRQLEQKQLVIAGSMSDTDVIGFYRGPAKSCLIVMHYISGNLISKDTELFDSPIEDDADAVSEVIRQYYEKRGAIPVNIFIPVTTPDAELLEEFFTVQAGRKVSISKPQRGDKARLVKTANVNAQEEVNRVSTHEEKTLKTLEWLQNALRLEAAPERIEAFDISNTGTSDIVGSMTVFVRCKPLKKDYRRFKIKTVGGQDDYGSMREVVSRRIARCAAGDEKFAVLPDLMLIDGGANHAAVAREALREAGVELPVYGMVKDDKHRTRALVSAGGEEIGLSGSPSAFALIGTIQEETHRFAVEFHRSLRSKNSYKSKLDVIEGVGEKRRNNLIKRFGSLKAVSNAEIAELSEVVPKDVAGRIYRHFHEKSE